jgi:hypothetical protein
MSTLKAIRHRAQQDRQKTKTALLEKIRIFLVSHAQEPDYLAKIVNKLNTQGIFTLTGKHWTTRNLWQFLTTNGENLAALRSNGKTDSEISSVWQKDIPMDLTELVEWAMRYKKLGVLPIVVPDSVLLDRVEKMLERENLSFSGLIQELLTRWVAKKEFRIPEHKKLAKFSHPPICMSLLRNSGEHVVITMHQGQRETD